MTVAADLTRDEGAGLTVDLAETGSGRYQAEVRTGIHRFLVDQPPAVGGLGSGATPFEHLCAALGACTAMTLRAYADGQGWLLPKIRVQVVYLPRQVGVAHLERTIAIDGELTAAQSEVLLAVADRSPVLALLHPDLAVSTRLGPIGDPAETQRQAAISHWIALQQALRAS
jgi:uncharacterized OsmC-like protein